MRAADKSAAQQKYLAAMERVLRETGPALDAYHAEWERQPRWKRRLFSKAARRRALFAYMQAMRAAR